MTNGSTRGWVETAVPRNPDSWRPTDTAESPHMYLLIQMALWKPMARLRRVVPRHVGSGA
jgi:hypothetical protein